MDETVYTTAVATVTGQMMRVTSKLVLVTRADVMPAIPDTDVTMVTQKIQIKSRASHVEIMWDR